MSISAFAVDDVIDDRDISDKFQLGRYLVYDCLESTWVCTRKAEFDRCIEHRRDAKLTFRKNLRCANFNKYETTKACQKVQQNMVNRGNANHFCENQDKSSL